jgi:hypothetical protein
MPFSATISLTSAGVNATIFNIYSDVDSFTTPFETGVLRAAILAGITSTNVPNGTTECRITANCGTFVDIPLDDPFIYVYQRCDTLDEYYKIGLSGVKAEDDNAPTPNCYINIDSGFLSAMVIAYPSITENSTLITSSCECV